MNNEQLAISNEEKDMRKNMKSKNSCERNNKNSRSKNLLPILLLATCYLLLVFSCPEPLQPFVNADDEIYTPTEQTPPAGMGFFSLNVEHKPTARTVLPTWGTVAYTLDFTSADGLNTDLATINRNQSNIGEPVLLNAGEWNLIVAASNASGEVSQGDANFSIPAGGTTAASVTLYPVDDSGTGIFNWNINLSGVANLQTATMTVTKYSDGSSVHSSNLISTDNGSASLASGYYYIDIFLEKAAAENKAPFYKQEILHIYKNLTSAYNADFTDGDFANNYHTVTLRLNYSGSLPEELTCAHNTPLNYTPTRAGYIFGGWFTDNGTFINEVVTITRNITLYAKWVDAVSSIRESLVNIPASDGAWSVNGSNPAGGTATLSAFKMGKYQVTQEQFEAVMGTNPSSFTSGADAGEEQGKRPVEMVNWYHAIAFCNKLSLMEGLVPAYDVSSIDWETLAYASIPVSSDSTWNAAAIVAGSNGYRLPTEVQWQYAAQAGTSTEYTATTSNAWYDANSNSKTHQVGLKEANDFDLYDMLGNVWEWCWDWRDINTYPNPNGETDPKGAPSGSVRVMRGGSWYVSASSTHSANRNAYNPYGQLNTLGFRVVLPSTYTVTFNLGGKTGTPPPEQTVLAGGKATMETLVQDGTDFFRGWYTEPSLVNKWNFATDTVNSNITLYAKWDAYTAAYSAGDTGLGGGKIFYVDAGGFVMADTGEVCHYLEAAPSDSSTISYWAYDASSASVAGITTSTTNSSIEGAENIGQGRKDTQLIVAHMNGKTITGTAAQLAVASQGGYDDWFLPSLSELYLYFQSSVTGKPTSNNYWSSSQRNDTNAWVVNFPAGTRSSQVKTANHAVRPIRAFGTAEAPAYTVTFASSVATTYLPSPITGVTSGSTIAEPSSPPTTNAGGATLNQFRGWYKDDGTFAQAWDFANDTVTGNTTLYADWGYRPGDTGDGGGKIYYRSDAGFILEGYVFSGTTNPYIAYYLEAAPENAHSASMWGNDTAVAGITTNTVANNISAGNYDGNIPSIGQGRKDTMLIIAHWPSSTITAAYRCVAYRGPNNKDDWFLPSLSELSLYYWSNVTEQKPTGYFWSSSQYDSDYAWQMDFNDGSRYYDQKANGQSIRPIRAFGLGTAVPEP